MSSRSSGVMKTRSSRVTTSWVTWSAWCSSRLIWSTSGAAAVVLDPEQLLLQPGRLDGERGDRREEVEEFFVAWQQTHCNIRVTGRGEDNALPKLGHAPPGSLTPPVSPADSGVDRVRRDPGKRGPFPVRPAAMTQVTPTRPLERPAEEAFDRLTRLAARLLGAPVALVSVMGEDRAFLKSAVGVPEPWASERAMPLAYSFCRHVVSSGAPLVVEDTRRHPLVRSNPAIRELSWISYAGVPLTTGGGQTAGALCVIDALPRVWSPSGRGPAAGSGGVGGHRDGAPLAPAAWRTRRERRRHLPPPLRRLRPTSRDPAAGVFERLRAADGSRGVRRAMAPGQSRAGPSCSARRSRPSPAVRPSCRPIPPTGRPTTRPRGCCWPVSAIAIRRKSACSDPAVSRAGCTPP